MKLNAPSPQLLRWTLPAAIIGCFFLVVLLILLLAPDQDTGTGDRNAPLAVNTVTIETRSFPLRVASYGRVQPRTEIALQPQVSGRVVMVAPQFRDGGLFRSGDTMLQIETVDYEIAVARAVADLARAEEVLASEQGRARQAKREWRDLGDPAANALFLREPQVKAAEASLVAAKANHQQAELNLSRTRIAAPFDARVLRKQVDIGQLVNTNTTLAEIYATDYVEVRLPIKNSDLAFLALPEPNATQFPEVEFQSEINPEDRWRGRLVRTEGAIDESTRQLYSVAQIDRPFNSDGNQHPLKIGQYLIATVAGRTIPDAIVIPASAIYQGSYVYLLNGGVIERRDVAIAWQSGDQALISTGLQSGDELIVSPLGVVISGTPAKLQAPSAVDSAGPRGPSDDAGDTP